MNKVRRIGAFILALKTYAKAVEFGGITGTRNSELSSHVNRRFWSLKSMASKHQATMRSGGFYGRNLGRITW